MESKFFRHYVATLAYRANVALDDAPVDYPEFEAGNGVRTPKDLLAHISDVLTLGYSWFVDVERQEDALDWAGEVERFYQVIEKMDQVFADELPISDKASYEKLLQGPLADAMTHIGQLIMLRRLADAPVRAEHYIKAKIRIGDDPRNFSRR